MCLPWGNILDEFAGWIRTNIPSFIMSLLTALVFHSLIERLKRPRVKIDEDDDKYDPQFNTHYLHVRVINEKSKMVNRNPAIDCESEVYIIDAKTGKMKEGSPFSTKWARQTTIIPILMEDRIGVGYLPLNPPAERRINIYPGQIDAGKEGLHLDVIKKEKGKAYCWVHDPQLYVEPAKEKWKVNRGKYYVMIKVHFAGGCSKPAYFILENESEDPTYVKLKKCPKERINEMKGLFRLELRKKHGC